MAKHTYNSGRINRSGREFYRPEKSSGGAAAVVKKPRKRVWPKVVISLSVVLALGLGAVVALYAYVDSILDPGNHGVIDVQYYTPEEYDGDVVNLLIVGIDNEEGRDYQAGLGLTDMILYANFDLKNNKLNMLQIPRDSFIGWEHGAPDGKINSAFMHGADKTNPINNLIAVISDQYKLPVDHYVSMDMDALRDLVNALGGLRVYVAREMSHDGSYLPQGWQWLDGDAVEFFVRNRYGEGFERADIDRLDNQRYFYSALFRRLLNLTAGDIKNLLPVFAQYCKTDLSVTDMIKLAISVQGLETESILFCKVPGATGVPGYDGYYVVDLYGRGTEDEPGLANLLNQYFREYDVQRSAEELGAPAIQIPGNITLYPPNVQMMSSVQEEEGGADVDVEWS